MQQLTMQRALTVHLEAGVPSSTPNSITSTQNRMTPTTISTFRQGLDSFTTLKGVEKQLGTAVCYTKCIQLLLTNNMSYVACRRLLLSIALCRLYYSLLSAYSWRSAEMIDSCRHQRLVVTRVTLRNTLSVHFHDFMPLKLPKHMFIKFCWFCLPCLRPFTQVHNYILC